MGPDLVPETYETPHILKRPSSRENFFGKNNYIIFKGNVTTFYRVADKSLARPGRKQATATEDFDVHISYF